MSNSQRSSAHEKQRQVRADFSGNTQARRRRQFRLERKLQSDQSGYRIRRSRTHSSLHWQALLDLDRDSTLCPKFIEHACGDAITGIRSIERNSRVFIRAQNLNAATASNAHSDHVMQSNRLIDGAEIMISVGARGADVEAEIDLRKRTNRDCHRAMESQEGEL